MTREMLAKAWRWHVAFHEAGHAVAAYLEHIPFEHITVVPDAFGDYAGALIVKRHATYAEWDGSRVTDSLPLGSVHLQGKIITFLAGKWAAQSSPYHRIADAQRMDGYLHDHIQAENCVRKLFPDDERCYRYLSQCDIATELLFRKPRIKRAVKVLALALLRQSKISQDEAHSIIRRALKAHY